MNNNKYINNWGMAMESSRGIVAKTRYIFRNIAISAFSMIQSPVIDNNLRSLYLHYIFDDQKKEFENILIQLKNIGEFINTATLLDILQGEKEINNNYFHLSFDDGFRNVFKNGIEILYKHNVPATFFIPSAIISSNYDLEKHYSILSTKNKGVIEVAKWSDVKEAAKMGFDIGSHTRTHAGLSEISKQPEILMDEVIGSKKEIEDRLSISCKYISWPYGEIKHIDKASINIIKEAGYLACFSGRRGCIIPKLTDRLNIPRHQIETYWPLSHIIYFSKGGTENFI